MATASGRRCRPMWTQLRPGTDLGRGDRVGVGFDLAVECASDLGVDPGRVAAAFGMTLVGGAGQLDVAYDRVVPAIASGAVTMALPTAMMTAVTMAPPTRRGIFMDMALLRFDDF
jgi:hypothetical protein